MRKRIPLMLILLAALLMLPSCKALEKPVDDEDTFYVYYTEPGKAELYPVRAVLDPGIGEDNLITSVYAHMQTGGDEANYTSAVPQNVELNDYRIEEGNLLLNFGAEYYDLDKKEELVFRAALVRTFTQIENISTVEIRVEEQPLVIDDVIVVGPQRGSDFVDVTGTGLDAYTRTEATLYFSDETGQKLVPRTRTLTYTKAASLELQVLNSLIAGPDAQDDKAFRTLPVGVRVLSAGTVAGVCYVNLSDTILTENAMVSPEVCIYSMVDSLSEIPGVNSVQISINGNSNLVFMDQVDLRDSLKQNLDLIQAEEEKEE